jgi:phosphotransferase system  glucose/maltose/N-acetylglucosamine-specific IIC component
MKKYINYATIYAGAALVGGVFYREFTKFNNFTGETMLGKVHTHLFVLGMIVFLLVALFSDKYDLKAQKTFKIFERTYNPGLILAVTMMVVHGTLQVLGTPLSSGVSAAISGVAGIVAGYWHTSPAFGAAQGNKRAVDIKL